MTMKTIVYLVLILSNLMVLDSCKSNKKDPNAPLSISDVQAQFMADAKKRNKTFTRTTESVTFVDQTTMDSFVEDYLKGHVAGLCMCFSSGKPCKIYVLDFIWANSSNTSRKELLYHEYGHCNLYRPHFNYGLDIGNGQNSKCDFHVSFMYPGMASDYCRYKNKTPVGFMSDHWDDYVDELFTNNQSTMSRFGSFYPVKDPSVKNGILVSGENFKSNSKPPLQTPAEEEFQRNFYQYKIKQIDDCSVMVDDL